MVSASLVPAMSFKCHCTGSRFNLQLRIYAFATRSVHATEWSDIWGGGLAMASEWLTQTLRASLFSRDAVQPTEKAWTLITGEPEAENRVAVPGGRQYWAKFLGGILGVTFSGYRVDIVLTVDAQNATPTEERMTLPCIGKWSDLSGPFSSAVESFLENFEIPAVRVAFGAIAMAPAQSRDESYGNLSRLLKSVDVDPIHSSELVYRINWPVSSSVGEAMKLNRITSWSSVSFTKNLLQLSNEGIAVVAAPTDEFLHATQLEIDHSTPADRKEPIEMQLRAPIFKELMALASENLAQGERP